MLFCANTSNCSSLSKMWKCGELCWILLDDMISEPFGDMLPLNTVVHFCQTFLEDILVRHSFERVVVWKTLSWNTLLGHWKTNSLKTPSDALFGHSYSYELLWASVRPLARQNCLTLSQDTLVRHSDPTVFAKWTCCYLLRHAVTCCYATTKCCGKPGAHCFGHFPKCPEFWHWKSYHFRSTIPTGIHGSLRVFYGYFLHSCQTCCTKTWSAFIACTSCKMTQE